MVMAANRSRKTEPALEPNLVTARNAMQIWVRARETDLRMASARGSARVAAVRAARKMATAEVMARELARVTVRDCRNAMVPAAPRLQPRL